MRYLLLVLLLAACVAGRPDCAALPGGGHYCLQPGSAQTRFAVQQKVEARFRGRQETLIADFESDEHGMQFVALTPFGQKLLHVQYDNRTTTALRLPDTRLSPALVLAMLQLAQWPAPALKQGLSPEFTVEDTPGCRLILRDGVTALEIRHDAGSAPYRWLQITVAEIDLALEIETLNTDPISPSP